MPQQVTRWVQNDLRGTCSTHETSSYLPLPTQSYYEILTTTKEMEPAIAEGKLLLTVKYKSVCAEGGSTFEAKVAQPPEDMDPEEDGGMMAAGKVLYAARQEPVCDSKPSKGGMGVLIYFLGAYVLLFGSRPRT